MADRTSFPSMGVDYVEQYKGLVSYLRSHVYVHIDAGLAANSGSPGYYTGHNAEHFDEVVRYAGQLLGVQNGAEDVRLSPYELYILLVAIRIHDAGNIHGREQHEKKCFLILKNCGGAGEDDSEKKKIAKIAEAHGGKTSTGSKDTISELPYEEPIGNGIVRSQLLASIVRFADEICESRNRAANYLLNHGSLPEQSQVYHKYASAITASVYKASERKLSLKYEVTVEDVVAEWGCELDGEGKVKKRYLIDDILARLEKMDKERRYCNRFSRALYTVDTIRAAIHVVDKESRDILNEITIPDLCDTGYPEDCLQNLKEQLKAYCGADFGQKLVSGAKS